MFSKSAAIDDAIYAARGLFTHDEYLAAFTTCGLGVHVDATGLEGRGLYIGISSQ